jgi:hypothetical protein
MTAPRVTLSGLMLVVAFLAANLALLRLPVPFDLRRSIPLLIGLPLVLLEVAAWGAWRDRRPGRGFWVGYLLAGGLMTGSLAWALLRSPVYGVRPDGTFGVVAQESGLDHFWRAGLPAGIEGVRSVAAGLLGVVPAPVVVALIVAVASVPQVAPALVGGLIGRRIAGWRAAGANLPGVEPR